jgi:hypothetical protein
VACSNLVQAIRSFTGSVDLADVPSGVSPRHEPAENLFKFTKIRKYKNDTLIQNVITSVA